MAEKQKPKLATPKKPTSRKAIKVLRRRKALHVGIDLAQSPWTGTLVRAMPANVENHATHADDATASLLQLHRPQFPTITPRAGPGPMNRMARVMRGYDLVIVHGDQALPATMAHTLFGQAVKAPPLAHFHDGVDEVPKGWWARFRHKLGMARTPLVIVPTVAAAKSVTADWQVPPSHVRILPPIFPPAPKKPKPDAIPRLMKRAGEKWIAMRATDALALSDEVVSILTSLDDAWHLVVFGTEGQAAELRTVLDRVGHLARLHVTARLHGPAPVAGLFDLAVLDGRNGRVPPDMPALMAAGVPVIAPGPAGLAELLPPQNADLRVDASSLGLIVERVEQLATDEVRRSAAGAVNAEFAAAHADPAPCLAALSGMLGLASLEDR
ncbi:hypothetical protein EKN06_05100 [Croceicoccus ponticola]|uniref:Glycosyltransferase n=1 Tax=Croceicoccus ponticola TaxID=2217664 RepID=A0A437H1W5_9SPHN|nr:hypothetical protein [Croceicoccus ponticola]RVQ69546.1 hypothetical protein EKN06_05100 [Croceicoccus ponticola]